MDPLSVTASIIAILQLFTKVLAYLNDVKDASKDRVQCAIELSNFHSLRDTWPNASNPHCSSLSSNWFACFVLVCAYRVALASSI